MNLFKDQNESFPTFVQRVLRTMENEKATDGLILYKCGHIGGLTQKNHSPIKPKEISEIDIGLFQKKAQEYLKEKT